jgi:hypothetical protein
MEQLGKYTVQLMGQWDLDSQDDNSGLTWAICSTYEDAVLLATALIQDSLQSLNWSYDDWLDFGESPNIVIGSNETVPSFVASDCARELCQRRLSEPLQDVLSDEKRWSVPWGALAAGLASAGSGLWTFFGSLGNTSSWPMAVAGVLLTLWGVAILASTLSPEA